MKNKKGETATEGLGVFLTVFIVVIVGLVLLTAIAENVAETTGTVVIDNATFTTPANAGVSALSGRAIVGTITLANGTETVDAGNYTVTSESLINGALTATFTTDAAYIASQAYNISYTYQPTGYIKSGGGRSLSSLIVILTALSIMALALIPALRSKLLDFIGK